MKHQTPFLSKMLTVIAEKRPDLWPVAVRAIKEERDRLRRKDYTPEEQGQLDMARSLGQAAARTRERISANVFNGGNVNA